MSLTEIQSLLDAHCDEIISGITIGKYLGRAVSVETMCNIYIIHRESLIMNH